MNVVLFDGPEWEDLLPLTYTRPVAGLRIGIDTILDKWNAALNTECQIWTRDYLQDFYPLSASGDCLMINAAYLPNTFLADSVLLLEEGQRLEVNGKVVAARRVFGKDILFSPEAPGQDLHPIPVLTHEIIHHIAYPWHLFTLNDAVLRQDFARLTRNRTSESLSGTNRIIGEDIFAEKGAKAECSIINTTTGPVYLGADSEIMEGAIIRGGLALCEGSSVKMGAKLYGANTFGPHCKIGGEVTNSIFQEFSNKGHDGYLGNSVIGAWCNFGADTNSSNLKNNYKKVRIFNLRTGTMVDSGQQFLGIIMGDHSKTGINTMFNTGTVVGVSSNIFGAGFPPTHIPSFAWGGGDRFETYQVGKAIEVAAAVMARRNVSLTDEYKTLLRYLFDHTAKYRPAFH